MAKNHSKINTKIYARQHQRIEHEHEVAMASGGWGTNWETGRHQKRCVADSRRYHHQMMLARDPPELRAAKSARAALKRRVRSHSAKQPLRAAENQAVSGGLAAQKVMMSATLLHNAALDNPFLARMLRQDRIAGEASTRYRRSRHRRMKSTEVETAAKALQPAAAPVQVDDYGDAFDFDDVVIGGNRADGDVQQGGDSSAAMGQGLADEDEDDGEMDWGEDEDEGEGEEDEKGTCDTGAVSVPKQGDAVDEEAGDAGWEPDGTEDAKDEGEGEAEDNDDGLDDFIVRGSHGPVVLQLSSSPTKLAKAVAGGKGHIPFAAAGAQQIGLVAANQTASAGPGMTFNKELMRWEAAGGTAPGEEDFMADFGSNSDDGFGTSSDDDDES